MNWHQYNRCFHMGILCSITSDSFKTWPSLRRAKAENIDVSALSTEMRMVKLGTNGAEFSPNPQSHETIVLLHTRCSVIDEAHEMLISDRFGKRTCLSLLGRWNRLLGSNYLVVLYTFYLTSFLYSKQSNSIPKREYFRQNTFSYTA